MSARFEFNNLFVFEMANNHQGRVEHGKRIIHEMARVAQAHQIRAAIKFQFRDLDSFIHPAHRTTREHPHIPRFLSTRLSKAQFAELAEEVRRAGFVTMATPFDEPSVAMVRELGIEVIKIGSCSTTDWPLLEQVAESNKPVIVSTGGLTWKQIDDLVSFFDHRGVHYAILHCVALYPTPSNQLQLNRIDSLRRRYPDKVIGFSTHEHPDELSAVQVAVAKGARILERHVGVPAEGIRLNPYSSSPEQVDRWVNAAKGALVLCGSGDGASVRPEELEALAALTRGVYARQPLKAQTGISREDVYFAMPLVSGQLTSGEWKDGVIAKEDVAKDAPLAVTGLSIPHDRDRQILYHAIHTIKGMLNEARIALNTEFRVEFSHHYGVKEFPRIGATIIECINRDYCKKLVIQLPGQRHPLHYHKKKEETFQLLYGRMEIVVEGRRRALCPGDIQLVQQGVWHEFWTETGMIAEEISTTHYDDDSVYEDQAINHQERAARKTLVSNWGRYQL